MIGHQGISTNRFFSEGFRSRAMGMRPLFGLQQNIKSVFTGKQQNMQGCEITSREIFSMIVDAFTV